MDSRFDTVIHFEVKFGKLVFLIGRGLLNISQGRGIDNVANNESLDSLVLGNGLSGRDTPDTLDVATAVFVASVIASLDCHS
jgi:hypothetical protein